MHDDELRARYVARGIPSEWQELTPKQMRPAFRLFYRALPSPSMEVEGSNDAELLIHDPLTALREARILSAEGGEERILPADAETPSISTFVVNHEKTLNRWVMHASVAVSKNPHTVGITIVKEAEPEEGEASQEDETPQPAW
jgi:hypothetical protein